MKRYLIATMFGLTLFGTSCWHEGLNFSYEEHLEKTAKTYYRDLQWKYYDRIRVFIDPEDIGNYEKFVVAYRDRLNMTELTIKFINISPNKKEALVNVEIKYYIYPSVSEKTIMIRDKWVRRDKNWFVDDPQYIELFSPKTNSR